MIPSVDALKDFLEKNQSANFSQIARKFGINNVTVSEMIKSMEKDCIVSIEKIGQYKFVKLVK